MKISVNIRDKVGKNFETVEYKRIKLIEELDLERIAKECEVVIRNTIMEKSDSPTGHLASCFRAEKIIDGWGIGDINYLDNNAPYWNHQDKGSEGIGANWNHFLPKGYWQNGRWVKDSAGYSGVKPKTPIPAMNYISETLQKMEMIIPKLLRK